ncbi:MAG TPA: hypothetical protein VLI54_03395 [Bacillota bacterium]|nr:hypothetical protein [Bacillota bacterium]
MGAPLIPPMPDWAYAGMQAVDHFIPTGHALIDNRFRDGHSGDAKEAALWTGEFKDVYGAGDQRMFAALGVSVLDAAHVAAGKERANHETRKEVGMVSVIANVAIETQHGLLVDTLAGGYGAEYIDAMVDNAGGVLLRNDQETFAASRTERAVYAGLRTVHYRTIDGAQANGNWTAAELKDIQRAEMETAWAPLAETVKRAHRPADELRAERPEAARERLLQQARDLGGGVFGLTATIADILDPAQLSYESTVNAFRELGKGGMILLQLSRLPQDLRAGAQTLFTDAVRRAGPDDLTGTLLRELREFAFDEANVDFAGIRSAVESVKQRDILDTMRTEMQGKLVFNTLLHNRRLVTANAIRRILLAQPQTA